MEKLFQKPNKTIPKNEDRSEEFGKEAAPPVKPFLKQTSSDQPLMHAPPVAPAIQKQPITDKSEMQQDDLGDFPETATYAVLVEGARWVKDPFSWDKSSSLLANLPKGTIVEIQNFGEDEPFNKDVSFRHQWVKVKIIKVPDESDDELKSKVGAEDGWMLFSMLGSTMETSIFEEERTENFVMPLKKSAPEGTHTLEHFIELLELFEKYVRPDLKGNTKKEISILRKIYYGSPGWEQHLIPGAAHIDPGFEHMYRTESRDIETKNRGDFTVTFKNWSIRPASDFAFKYNDEVYGMYDVLHQNQELATPDGDFIDIGHVLAGLDAINHPSEINASTATYKFVDWSFIDRNVDAATWVGDLGSVLGGLLMELYDISERTDKPNFSEILETYAPAHDMLGNIDAYVIGSKDVQEKLGYNISSYKNGEWVSEILRRYYLEDDPSGMNVRDTRFTTFTDQMGWLNKEGGVEIKDHNHVTNEIISAAALFLQGIGFPLEFVGDVETWGMVSNMQDKKDSGRALRLLSVSLASRLIDMFEAQLDREVRKENLKK